MAHVREQIRTAAVASLTGLTTTGSRVYDSRNFPLDKSELPGLCVYTLSEAAEVATNDGLVQREVQLVIEGYAEAAADIDGTLDDIAAEVEAAIENSAGIAALVKHLTLTGTEVEYSDGGNKPIGAIQITYNVLYMTAKGAPTVAV